MLLLRVLHGLHVLRPLSTWMDVLMGHGWIGDGWIEYGWIDVERKMDGPMNR